MKGKGGKARRNQDSQFREEELQESSEEDAIMDDFETEVLSDDEEHKKGYKKKARKRGVQEADLGLEDDEDTIFIDNLPNEEFEIKDMLKEVDRLVRKFELKFFEEEDSDVEDELKRITNVTLHSRALEAFKDSCNLKHFWCMPLSSDIRNFNFQKLIDT